MLVRVYSFVSSHAVAKCGIGRDSKAFACRMPSSGGGIKQKPLFGEFHGLFGGFPNNGHL